MIPANSAEFQQIFYDSKNFLWFRRHSVGILKFRRGIKINLKIPANEQIIPRTVSESGGLRRIPTGFRSESSESDPGRILPDSGGIREH